MAGFDSLDIAISVDGNVATVLAAGELDAFSVSELDAGIDEAWRGGADKVIVDLAGLTFIDGRGMDTLVQASVHARQAGHRFSIQHPSPQVQRIERILDLDESVLPLELP